MRDGVNVWLARLTGPSVPPIASIVAVAVGTAFFARMQLVLIATGMGIGPDVVLSLHLLPVTLLLWIVALLTARGAIGTIASAASPNPGAAANRGRSPEPSPGLHRTPTKRRNTLYTL